MFARRTDNIQVSARPCGAAAGESCQAQLFAIRNETRRTVIGDSIRRAATSQDRRRGLLGCDALQPGEGLWIVPCEGIHTFGMRFAIDVVFLDRKLRVRKIIPGLRPRRISISLTSHSVVELPVGVIARSGTRAGDSLRVDVGAARSAVRFY